jgi:hypothetical protein
MGQYVACLLAYSVIVLLRPALLKSYNVWLRTCGGDLDSDFRETLITKFGDELETPAIERQYAYA